MQLLQHATKMWETKQILSERWRQQVPPHLTSHWRHYLLASKASTESEKGLLKLKSMFFHQNFSEMEHCGVFLLCAMFCVFLSRRHNIYNSALFSVAGRALLSTAFTGTNTNVHGDNCHFNHATWHSQPYQILLSTFRYIYYSIQRQVPFCFLKLFS